MVTDERCFHCGIVIERAIDGGWVDAATRQRDCAARPGEGHENALHGQNRPAS